jgi:hypothetical protein
MVVSRNCFVKTVLIGGYIYWIMLGVAIVVKRRIDQYPVEDVERQQIELKCTSKLEDLLKFVYWNDVQEVCYLKEEPWWEIGVVYILGVDSVLETVCDCFVYNGGSTVTVMNLLGTLMRLSTQLGVHDGVICNFSKVG